MRKKFEFENIKPRDFDGKLEKDLFSESSEKGQNSQIKYICLAFLIGIVFTLLILLLK